MLYRWLGKKEKGYYSVAQDIRWVRLCTGAERSYTVGSTATTEQVHIGSRACTVKQVRL